MPEKRGVLEVGHSSVRSVYQQSPLSLKTAGAHQQNLISHRASPVSGRLLRSAQLFLSALRSVKLFLTSGCFFAYINLGRSSEKQTSH